MNGRAPTGWLGDLAYPATDAGVAAQVVALVVTTAVITWLVRRERALVLLTWGVALVIFGFFGLRSVH